MEQFFREIFGVIDSDPIVTFGCKVMMTSSKCPHFNCFELFSYALVRSSIFERERNRFFSYN